MLKNGQVTVFIILGIIIILMIGILFYFQGYISLSFLKNDEEVSIPTQLKVVVDNINYCLESTSYDALYYIGVHGGYYKTPEEGSITYFTEKIPYYYLNNKIIIPKINSIQEGISNYIDDNLGSCLELNKFRDEGFIINESNYTASTIIKEKFVSTDSSTKIAKGWSVPKPGCFIATAVYGTSLAPEINTLRVFRDNILLSNSIGKKFVHFYYRFSPPIANFISKHSILKTCIRKIFIAPSVNIAKLLNKRTNIQGRK